MTPANDLTARPEAQMDLPPRRGGAPLVSLYLRLRGREATGSPDWLPRPDGPLIAFVLGGPAHAPALSELIRRLRQERWRLSLLVSGAEDSEMPPQTLTAPLAPDDPAQAAAFLDHWRPDLLVLIGDCLPPALVQAAAERGLAVTLLDGRAPARRPGWRWWPGIGRALVQRLDRLMVQDAAAQGYFRRLGAPARRIEIAGRLEEAQGALPCTEAERAAMAHSLNARPVWLAVGLPEAEEAAVMAAHREAVSARHRLLLIIVPAQPSEGQEMARRLEAEGWDVALRSRDEDPEEADQVYIADTEGELGLWYRLAPVTYIGGTLSGEKTARHPYEAAALGSAIVHGPKTLDIATAYARLVRAGGSRLLRGAPELGLALSELLSPDRAAEMAHNAWDVTSSGADVTDRMVDYLLGLLDTAMAAAQARLRQDQGEGSDGAKGRGQGGPAERRPGADPGPTARSGTPDREPAAASSTTGANTGRPEGRAAADSRPEGTVLTLPTGSRHDGPRDGPRDPPLGGGLGRGPA